MHRGGLWLAAAFVLAGCADEGVPIVKWSKPDTTYDRFVQDRADCVSYTREQSQHFYMGGARYGGSVQHALNADLFVSCMTGHGYREDPAGFAAPPGEEIALTP
jgi:hypothetical protein